MPYTRRITHTTAIHCHLNHLLLPFRKQPFLNILSHKCLTSTGRILTEKTLFSISRLSRFDHTSTLTGRTMHRIEPHQRLSSTGEEPHGKALARGLPPQGQGGILDEASGGKGAPISTGFNKSGALPTIQMAVALPRGALQWIRLPAPKRAVWVGVQAARI